VNRLPEGARVLLIQTAFPGDVILTLPLVQSLKRVYPATPVDVLVTPLASELLAHHPAIHEVLIYDKRGKDSGIPGFLRMVRLLRLQCYSVAFVPHRSFRSAMLARMAQIPVRIGFDKSAGRRLFTDIVHYDPSLHETGRNLSLLKNFIPPEERERFPALYPDEGDRRYVDDLLQQNGVVPGTTLIGIAPGSVWPTKRWPEAYFIDLIKLLADKTDMFVLIGGKGDIDLCGKIKNESRSPRVVSTAGECTFLQSAEVIRRCRLMVSNDSAPMHIGTAMGTPVVALFGPTVPDFGFGPLREVDTVIEVEDLSCRPCTIHGGKRCPIRTFDCMLKLSPERVVQTVRSVIGRNNI
jgi:heptosyltransferase-2